MKTSLIALSGIIIILVYIVLKTTDAIVALLAMFSATSFVFIGIKSFIEHKKSNLQHDNQ